MVVFDKPYQALAGVEVPSVVLGHEPEMPSSPLLGDEALQVRLLLPDNPSFDMAVNTMTFEPGAHLSLVETHVMEHGLLFLQGVGCTGWATTGTPCRPAMSSGWPPTAHSGLGRWAKHPAST